MNSFNHYAYGAIGDWMYRVMTGLDIDAPGYKSIRIQPRPGGGFTQAAADQQTLYGLAASRWQRDEKNLTLEVDIPANTTATVYIPAAAAADITENGKPLADVPDIRVTGMENGHVVLKIGSGKYRFVVAGGGVKIVKINFSDYTGKYKVEGLPFPHVEVVDEKGELVAKALFFTHTLEPDPKQADVFLGGEGPIRFFRNAEGKVNRLTMSVMGGQIEGMRE